MAPHKVLGVIVVLPEVLGAGAEPLGVAAEEEGVRWAGAGGRTEFHHTTPFHTLPHLRDTMVMSLFWL